MEESVMEAVDRDASGPGTRDRIQQVALELFAEHGYDGTSLRQIAERLGITKAALYYHFQSKDDIVTSLMTDMFAKVDALTAWARGEPPTAETRHEVLRRYADLLTGSHSAMRFSQHPRAGAGAASHPAEGFKQRMVDLSEVLQPPQATVEQRGKAILAVMSLHIGTALGGGQSPFQLGTEVDPSAGRAAMMKIAMDLVADQPEESDRG